MNADPNQVKAIFLDAVENYRPDQWAGFLDQACAGHPEMRDRVEVLLQAHREAGTVQHQANQEGRAPSPLEVRASVEHPGTVIGPYKLLEQIGEGGMGLVFMAEQTQPVRRKVALKVLKPGMDTRQVVARFEAERQALAIMDHPNIAKVFDGGATATGWPFFVMELVKGLPITEFCDQYQLATRQRLELFLRICQAVQHAHQKGIIHGDLKPSNVLVTMHDTTPVVKVIDFGVAKALGQELTEKTLFTGFTQMIGTPLYMSPEQAGQSGLDIDTRSDIYSLGVLLYELLTGMTPFDKERFKRAAYEEIRRIIREEEPPRPSTRLSDSTDSLPSISAQRQTDPVKLTKLVRGELDWIVMKTLEKDRNRRYETANSLADDVQRYLADEPVQACPPSAGYRLRKFVRRNRTALTTSALLGVMLVLAVTTLAVSYFQVDQALAERTQALSERTEALNAKTAALDDKSRALAAERSARNDLGMALIAETKARARTREALDEMSTRVIEDWLARLPDNSPEQRAFLQRVVTFYEEFAAATGNDEQTKAGVADAHLRLAALFHQLGRYQDSAQTGAQAATLFKVILEQHPGDRRYRTGLMLALRHQARGLHGLRKTEDVDRVQREAIRLAEELVTEVPTDLVAVRHLSVMLTSRGVPILNSEKRTPERAAAALTELDRALLLQKRLIAAKPGNDVYLEDLATIHNARTLCLVILGRAVEADQERVAALELFEAIAHRSPSFLNARVSSGRMRLNMAMTYADRPRNGQSCRGGLDSGWRRASRLEIEVDFAVLQLQPRVEPLSSLRLETFK